MSMLRDFNNILNYDQRKSRSLNRHLKCISYYDPIRPYKYISTDVYAHEDMLSRHRARPGAIPIFSVNADGTITIDNMRYRSKMRYSTWNEVLNLVQTRAYKYSRNDTNKQTIYKRGTNVPNSGLSLTEWLSARYETEEVNA
jgi:hypothetical protein